MSFDVLQGTGNTCLAQRFSVGEERYTSKPKEIALVARSTNTFIK
jgi:hypothetical protein